MPEITIAPTLIVKEEEKEPPKRKYSDPFEEATVL